jgi:peptidoglycan/xylan/chitin deacetylase (PgdA/CDA1 family)
MSAPAVPRAISQGAFATLRAAAAPYAKSAMLRGGGYAALRRLLPSRRVAILRYHAICTEEGYAYADPSICISPQAFTRHVRYLAAHYAVLSLDEVVGRMASRRPLPPNAVAITFDDGYADNLAAARTLNRYGLPATFFITAGCLAGGEAFWLTELRQLMLAVPAGTIRLDAGPAAALIHITDAATREKAIRRLTRLIKSHDIEVRESLRAQLRQAARTSDAFEHVESGFSRTLRSAAEYMLRWQDLAEMQRLGMSIGSHTLTHPNLPSAGIEAATQEIAGSKAQLERELGTAVTLFSYPNGGAERYYTPQLQQVVAGTGFNAACTSRNGFADVRSDLFALQRIEVQERLEDLIFALEVERFAFTPVS